MDFIVILICWMISVLSAVLLGLIPYSIGKSKQQDKLAVVAWLVTSASGCVALQIPATIVFVILTSTRKNNNTSDAEPLNTAEEIAAAPRAASMALSCLSGPMQGAIYPIGAEGIQIGRDQDCAIRFESGTPGVSRHHCELHFEGDALMLTDLDSAYGTYLADGQQLDPMQPTRVFVGTRFHLGDKENLFQVILAV